MFSTQDSILILIVVLLLFGANKLPEMARSLGKATGEFKKAMIESETEIKQLNKPLNSEDAKIRDLAINMGIAVENKMPDQLLEEICSK